MKDFCEHLYGTSIAEEIVRKKTTEKQIRAVAGGKDIFDVSLTPEECKKLCKKANNFEYLQGYENRVRQYTVSDETVDRYGDIVRARGIKLDNYTKNPVMQFAHDYSMPPIGISIKTWYDKESNSLKAYALFLDERVDSTGRADLIFRFVRSNGMRACSIGFDPLEFNNPATEAERSKLGLGQFGVEYLSADMLEFSPVPLPANPNCLSNAYVKSFTAGLGKTLRSGLFTAKDVDVLKTYPLFENTVLDEFIKELGTKSVPVPELPVEKDVAKKPYPNEHAARVREPEEFEDDSFRRKNIKEGIDIIIGKLKGDDDKMETQAYRFNKQDFTADEAKKWLKDNNIEYISFEPASEKAVEQSQPQSVNVIVNLESVQKELYTISEKLDIFIAETRAAKESMEKIAKEFDTTARKALSVVELGTRRSTFYDNEKRVRDILKI